MRIWNKCLRRIVVVMKSWKMEEMIKCRIWTGFFSSFLYSKRRYPAWENEIFCWNILGYVKIEKGKWSPMRKNSNCNFDDGLRISAVTSLNNLYSALGLVTNRNRAEIHCNFEYIEYFLTVQSSLSSLIVYCDCLLV